MTKYSQRLIEILEFYRCKPCENMPLDKDFDYYCNKKGVYFSVPKRIQSWDDANNYLRIAGIRDRLP
jgi:hypothetical protein